MRRLLEQGVREFDADDNVTLCAYAVTRHRRATPIIWKTHRKSELEGHRTQWGHALVQQLHRAMSPRVAITRLADRGFGDQKLYELLTLLGWDYVIRFRGVILVESAAGEVRPASDWVHPGGRATLLCGRRSRRTRPVFRASFSCTPAT